MTEKRWGGLLCVFLTLLLIIIFYHRDISNANHLGYGVWGDGYKNFYTLAYYVKYDSGTHFSGMNYPYGENILFTDNQPLLAFLLKPAVRVFPHLQNHLHVLISLLLFLSLIFCAVIVYLLLLELQVLPFLAAILASFIAMMSPNWDHFVGLYSLAYTSFFPFLIYINFKIIHGKRIPFYTLLAVLVVGCFSFIHLYFLAIALLFALSSCFVLPILFRQSWRINLPKVAALMVTVIIPLLCVKGYLYLTDSIADRPQSPWGYLAGYSKLHYFWLHPSSLLYRFIETVSPAFSSNFSFGYDAKCYLGLAAILLLFAGVILFAKAWYRNQEIRIEARILLVLLIGSLPVLLFAMAIPFRFQSFESVYDLLPNTIKQFRAAARFSWIFYYTATITAALICNYIFLELKLKSKRTAWAFLLLVCGIWLTDTITTSIYQAQNFKTYSTELNEQVYEDSIRLKLSKLGYNFESFQAILPLPFYHIGSEKICIASKVNFSSMQVSLVTGLPILGGQMSRTSISQTLDCINLLSDPYIKKDIITTLKDKKPFLITADQNSLNKKEKAITQKATFLFSYEGLDFMYLSPQIFSDSISYVQDQIKHDLPTYFKHSHYRSNDSTHNVVIESFDAKSSKNHLFGTGAQYAEKSVTLFNDTLPSAKTNSEYEFSIWLYADEKVASLPIISLIQFDSTGSHPIESLEQDGKYVTNAYNGWIRTSIPFTLKNAKNKISIIGKSDQSTYDELLIKPKSVSVVSQYKGESFFLWNNYPIYR